MKRRTLKHFIQFTAVMSLCVAVLTGTPTLGGPGSGPADNTPMIPIENPEASISEAESEKEPEIAPLNDLESDRNKKL